MRNLVVVALSLIVVGCAGKVDYMRPASKVAPSANVKVVERSRDAVWNGSIPELGKRFFIINNLEKSSGLMNVSYTGDPERYIDCGTITSYVKNARGERTYNFSGAKAQQSYEIMSSNEMRMALYTIDRRMNLEGRVNLIFEEIGPTTTRVTANTRYVVTRTQIALSSLDNNSIPRTTSDTLSFNSGTGASFPTNAQGSAAECVSTGILEGELLSAIK